MLPVIGIALLIAFVLFCRYVHILMTQRLYYPSRRLDEMSEEEREEENRLEQKLRERVEAEIRRKQDVRE